jgi:tRNA-2-methylthio-N6-dimethylallyladenosine synthase
VAFDGVFSFCYSPRKYTRASKLPDSVARDTARARLQALQAAQKGITLDKSRGMVGSRTEVLVEGLSKNSSEELTGRTRTNRVVNFKGTPDMIGKLVEVEIVKAFPNSLRGLREKP